MFSKLQTPRLVVVTQTHNLWGGIESWMADLFPAMESVGWDVKYALALGARYNLPAKFVQAHNYIRSYRVLDGRVGTPLSRQRAILRALEYLRADILMPVAIGDALPAFREFRRKGGKTRIVIPVHSPYAPYLADIMGNADVIDVIGVVSGLLYQWAVEAFAGTSTKVLLIRNGVKAPVRSKTDNQSEILRLGVIGRLESEIHKRTLDLVPILKSLRDLGQPISLTIVGDGPSAQELAAATLQYRQFHDIRLLGFINRETIYRQIYPELDCILLTSEHEGSPLVLIEAMRNGVVPISSRFAGHASEGLLAPEQNCLTFSVGDTSAAAVSIKRLARDRSLLRRLAVGAKASSAIYDHEHMVHGWMAACLTAFDTVPRKPANTHVAFYETYGRLERLGLPPTIIDLIRKARGKWFRHSSGFDEWPGSLSADEELAKQISDRLIAIENAKSASLYREIRA
jgi:glycosyltransferase involved in cell wall biosynthesis